MPRASKKSVPETSVARERAVTPAFLAGLVVVGVLVVTGAVMIGRSDNGEINVPDTINKANEDHAQNGGGEQVSVGNPALRNLPNGGLVVPENPVMDTPPVEVPPETSSTTDASASTTASEVIETETTEENITETPSEETPSQ